MAVARFERLTRPQPVVVRYFVAGRLQAITLRCLVDGRPARFVLAAKQKDRRDRIVVAVVKRVVFACAVLLPLVVVRAGPLVLNVQYEQLGWRLARQSRHLVVYVVWPLVAAMPFALQVIAVVIDRRSLQFRAVVGPVVLRLVVQMAMPLVALVVAVGLPHVVQA